MKKLLATMCAFALVIPCVLGFAACKKGPIKVAGKTFAYDHLEVKFDSDEAKNNVLVGGTVEDYIKDMEEGAHFNLSAVKFTKTEFVYGTKATVDAKEYDFSGEKSYYKQSKEKITMYEDKDLKIKEDTDGAKVYTTTKYLIVESYVKDAGMTVIQYYKAI